MTGVVPSRILMTADAVGGVWQYANELAAGLTPYGFETVLALIGPTLDSPLQEQACSTPGVRVVDTGLTLDWLGDLRSSQHAAGAIAELARAERADLIHLNSPALAAGRSFGIPLLGVAHGCLATWWEAARPGQPLDPAFLWHHELMTRGLRACDRVVAPSASFAECLRRQYRLPALPVVVHNGRSALRARRAGASHDCAFTAGRLWDEVKNARTLDAAAARLPFPFHAAGQLRAPHGETVAFEHLHSLGQLGSAEMARWLAARPVFVSAATFEPFGLAVLEAASSGCALVLSDIPTFRELWDGAATFVDPLDDRGFAEAIELSVQDLDYRRRLGEAAAERARRYTSERMVAAMAAHYLDLVGGRVAA